MNREDGYKKAATYHSRDFGDGGNQEPNETLVNEEQHINGQRTLRPARSTNSLPVSTRGVPDQTRCARGGAGGASQ
jgi:hypothetical protein